MYIWIHIHKFIYGTAQIIYIHVFVYVYPCSPWTCTWCWKRFFFSFFWTLAFILMFVLRWFVKTSLQGSRDKFINLIGQGRTVFNLQVSVSISRMYITDDLTVIVIVSTFRILYKSIDFTFNVRRKFWIHFQHDVSSKIIPFLDHTMWYTLRVWYVYLYIKLIQLGEQMYYRPGRSKVHRLFNCQLEKWDPELWITNNILYTTLTRHWLMTVLITWNSNLVPLLEWSEDCFYYCS